MYFSDFENLIPCLKPVIVLHLSLIKLYINSLSKSSILHFSFTLFASDTSDYQKLLKLLSTVFKYTFLSILYLELLFVLSLETRRNWSCAHDHLSNFGTQLHVRQGVCENRQMYKTIDISEHQLTAYIIFKIVNSFKKPT